MHINKPIFIIGVGRSGSTIFHRMLAKHENAAWLSTLAQKYPDRPDISGRLMRIIDFPLVGGYLKNKLNTFEAFDFWEQYANGFRKPCRDLLQQDVSERAKSRVIKALEQIPNNKRDRLLLKITGWPRVGFLQEIFPEAKFIHIVRDGRAVVNSMLNVNFWNGWMGPENWRWGALAPHYQEEWERHDRSFVILAAIQWKLLMDSYRKAQSLAKPDNYLELKYEDLCHAPLGTMIRVTSFCELDWTPKFESSIRKIPLKNTNDKWTKDLSSHQQKILNESLADYLGQYEYL